MNFIIVTWTVTARTSKHKDVVNMSSIPRHMNRTSNPNPMMALLNPMVVPADPNEVREIQADAFRKAAFYVGVILGLYLVGLVLVLVHYMNGAFGRWNWTLADVWEEITPDFGEDDLILTPSVVFDFDLMIKVSTYHSKLTFSTYNV